MNKMLRRKFVFSSMIATSILLILLIGTINVVNVINMNRTAEMTLETIGGFSLQAAEAPESRPEKPAEKPDMQPPEQQGRNAYDTYMASNFFVVEYSSNGEVSRVDVSRTSRYDEAEAVEMAAKAVESGRTDGRDGKCLFLKQYNPKTGGYNLVFLDTSENSRMVVFVLVVSLLVGAICWLLMLLITTIVSNRAVRPIAESIDKQKQFITDAGHEYKTPLAIIRSNADAMELYMGENKWLTNIKHQVERLTGLTQDMLLLAKIDEGNVNVMKSEVDVSEIVKRGVAAFEQEAKEREIDITARIEDGLMKKCNRDDIDKVLGILLDNSLKYSRQGGRIDVRLTGALKGPVLSVENDCEKLPDVPPEKLFERFYRADKARSRDSGGSGIGLSIAKAITESYGGSIDGEYIGENRIRFTVRW